MSKKNQPYKSFVGVDIGKSFFDVAIIGDPKIYRYENTNQGFKKCFYKTFEHFLRGIGCDGGDRWV